MDIEKSIEFLIQNQARYEAQNEERMSSLAGVVHVLLETQNRTEQRIQLLTEAQLRTEQRVQELAESQKQTTGNLNALIKVVDDLVRRDGRRS